MMLEKLLALRGAAAMALLGGVSMLLVATVQTSTWTTDSSAWHDMDESAVLHFICKTSVDNVTQALASCPLLWQRHGDLCYVLSSSLPQVSDRMGWREAEAVCVLLGAHLASIASEEENAFVFDMCLAAHEGCWIGLQRSGVSEGQISEWRWTDETEFEFYKWATDLGQPDDHGENAVCMLPQIVEMARAALVGPMLMGWLYTLVNISVVCCGFICLLHAWKRQDANTLCCMMVCDSVCVGFLILGAIVTMANVASGSSVSSSVIAEVLFYVVEAACLFTLTLLTCDKQREFVMIPDTTSVPTVVGAPLGRPIEMGTATTTVVVGATTVPQSQAPGVVNGISASGGMQSSNLVVVGSPVRKS
eukprot:gb/GFBE01010722.1/.p1 GENE.gb/GFBE01010722.1/~~gb/GFBE01010722.1/.p1  ORF type:complete len:362 (+),score=67.48 gb/GFBE01010722.1/:1-1086(+)